VVCSDETSARVRGKTWWEWVFVGTLAVLHVIRPSRGKAVVQALFGATQPMVWVSDMLGSPRGHAVEWQVCLAHLLRDARYAVECGDVAFSAAFKRLLLRASAIGRRRDALNDTTLKQYHADLDRRLDRIMAAVPIPGSSPGTSPGRRLRKRIAANRGHLFVFVTNRCVPYTNNVSERNLASGDGRRRAQPNHGQLSSSNPDARRIDAAADAWTAARQALHTDADTRLPAIPGVEPAPAKK
jgi:transposase